MATEVQHNFVHICIYLVSPCFGHVTTLL